LDEMIRSIWMVAYRRTGEEDMKSGAMDLRGKRIIVLSDNDELAQAIELSLSHCLALKITRIPSSLPESKERDSNRDEFDMIVLATSLPTSEPVVMLAQAALTQQIGRVPLLIVSDRPFDPDMHHQFFHLDFPMNAHALRDKIREILHLQMSQAINQLPTK